MSMMYHTREKECVQMCNKYACRFSSAVDLKSPGFTAI